jgi:hypothetical protein
MTENNVQEKHLVQEDNTYGRKSNGRQVVKAESQFIHYLYEAAGRLLADPAGKFDHRAGHCPDALRRSGGGQAEGQHGKDPG